jgi:hypothetical protein
MACFIGISLDAHKSKINRLKIGVVYRAIENTCKSQTIELLYFYNFTSFVLNADASRLFSSTSFRSKSPNFPSGMHIFKEI